MSERINLRPNNQLLANLELIVSRGNENYESDSIERVRKFVSFEIANPGRYKPYRTLRAVDDFLLYHRLHPEWQSVSTSFVKVNKEFKAFHQSFNEFVKGITRSEDERRRIMYKVFPQYRYIDWSELRTVDDWKTEFNRHPEWEGKTVSEISRDQKSGGTAFYKAFCEWTAKLKPRDSRERRKLLETVFIYNERQRREFNSIEDWEAEFNSNPGWAKMKVEELQKDHSSGGAGFMQSFYKWVSKNADDPTEAVNLRRKFVPHLNTDWSRFTRINDWIEEYSSHSEWRGISPSQDTGDLKKFYKAFSNWINKQRVSPEQRYDFLREVFPDYKAPFLYRFNGKTITFGSQSERIVAILLNDYRLIINFIEGTNIHVSVSSGTRHSIDFLIGNHFIEFHPTSISEKRGGINMDESTNQRSSRIDKEKFKGFYYYQIWTIRQLYDVLGVLKSDLDSKTRTRELERLNRNQFENFLQKAWERTLDFDLNKT